MQIAEQHIAKVVTELSAGASDPRHVQATVGVFMRRQPTIGHYVASHNRELGAEGVVLTLLHAWVVQRSAEIAAGRMLPVVQPAALDGAARADLTQATLEKEQPALCDYFRANVAADDPVLGGKRHATVMELLRLVTRALLAVA